MAQNKGKLNEWLSGLGDQVAKSKQQVEDRWATVDGAQGGETFRSKVNKNRFKVNKTTKGTPGAGKAKDRQFAPPSSNSQNQSTTITNKDVDQLAAKEKGLSQGVNRVPSFADRNQGPQNMTDMFVVLNVSVSVADTVKFAQP